jgi:hypothetical protein
MAVRDATALTATFPAEDVAAPGEDSMDQVHEGAARDDREWPLRPLLLGGIGLVTGLLAHFLIGSGFRMTLTSVQLALLAGLMLGAVMVGFTLERRLWWASLAFAAAVALVGALVTFWNGNPGGWSASEGWRMVSLVLAIAIAAPLFQAARDEGAPRFPYAAVHDHAWTNVVLWGACWLFVGIVLAMLWLLAALFQLIELSFLRRLLEREWFWRALVGLAFGAGLGLLREHDPVVRLLQRVVATVLAVLAPVLAAGLILFLLALPFTGLNALWNATSATTPILLCCTVGALILANAVIGNAPAEERHFPPVRYGAMGLAAVMLPLAVLAAIATSLRTGQYGFTPERLWAIVFGSLACLYGAAYLLALVRGRLGWAARARPLNLQLAFVVCGVALLLATPLVSFNAISTRDQVARLESGRVSPDRFDWRALALDFGAPGKAALKRLQGSANATIREKATEVAKAENRWDVEQASRESETRQKVAANVRMLPSGSRLPEALRDAMAEGYDCTGDTGCTLVLLSPGEAMLFSDSCFRPQPTPTPSSASSSPIAVPPARYACQDGERYLLANGKWQKAGFGSALGVEDQNRIAQAYRSGSIEVRTVPRRQLFVGGVPVGQPFE